MDQNSESEDSEEEEIFFQLRPRTPVMDRTTKIHQSMRREIQPQQQVKPYRNGITPNSGTSECKFLTETP